MSKTTFYFHKKQRDPAARFSAPMQRFLNDKPVTVSTPISTASGSRKPGRNVTKHTKSNAQGCDLANSGQATGHQEANVQVSVSFLLQQFVGLEFSLLSRIMAISPTSTTIFEKGLTTV